MYNVHTMQKLRISTFILLNYDNINKFVLFDQVVYSDHLLLSINLEFDLHLQY